MRRSTVTLCGALALCAAAPATAAAGPFTLSTGAETPDVAVDGSGTGHVVFNVPATTIGGNDVTQYCRLPRGATSCDVLTNLTPPAISSNDEKAVPRVFAAGAGATATVVVLTTRGGNDTVYRYVSSDGGTSFAGPTAIGDDGYAPLSSAALGGTGPAVLRIAGGGELKATPLGSAATTGPLDLFPTGSYARVAFDGGGPVAAAQSDDGHVLYTRYQGAGPYTSAASWTAPADAGPGTGPELVGGGSGGVYLFSRVVPGPYTVRHLDAAGFGTPANVTPPDLPVGSDQGFAQDPAGGLHAVVRDIGEGGTQGGALYTASTDGGRTWMTPLQLADRSVGDVFHLRVAALGAKDGFAVWDANGVGRVQAAALGSATTVPSGGGGGAPAATCPTVSFRPVEALSLDGCWAQDGTAYVAPGRARINGLDLDPKAGAKIVVDPAKRTITTRGGAGAYVHAGVLPVAAGPIAWTIPNASTAHLADADTGGLGASLFGLKVKGSASVDLQPSESTLGLHVELPDVFGKVTGDVRVKADNASGLRVDGVDVEVSDALLGPLEVKDLALHYLAAGDVWQGKADLVLPPRPPGARLLASMGFKGGAFDYATGSFTFPAPGVTLAPNVFLNEIHFALTTHPTKLAGGVKITGGPQILGTGAVAIDGDLSYTFADPPAPAILKATGTGKVAGIPIADVGLEYRSSGLFRFGAHLDYDFADVFRVKAGIDGFVDTSAGTFMVDGSGSMTCAIPLLCPLSVHTILSSKGVALCGSKSLGPITADLGVGYKWEGKVEVFLLGGCDLDGYRVSASAAQAGGARAVRLRAGRFAMVGVAGAPGRPPQVTLRRGSARVRVARTFVDARHGVTYLAVLRPRSASYRVVPAAGSPAITKVAAAAGLPEPSVRGRVGGKGHRRVLSWRLRAIPGQRVTFIERSGSVARRLGVAHGARGRLRFTPGDGAAGRRTVYALVEQRGRPRARLKVTTYVAPAPARPATPKGLAVTRTGRTVVARWRAVAGIRLYRVEAALTDGRRVVRLLRARRLTLADVAPAATGTIKVAAARPDLRTGRAASVRVLKLGAKPKSKPKPKKKRRR